MEPFTFLAGYWMFALCVLLGFLCGAGLVRRHRRRVEADKLLARTLRGNGRMLKGRGSQVR
jgi:hypothetical protein